MKPLDVLVQEHRLNEQVLNCLERMAEEAARRGDLDAGLVGDAVGFFRTFVHGWHFPREEAYVGRAMAPENPGQTEDLKFHDHERCRGHLQGMEEAVAARASGDRRAMERFVEHAHAYIAVMMKHVEDEEDRIFPTVERTLTEEREVEAVLALRHAESQVTDRRALNACVAAAHRLADRFNVARALPNNPTSRV